MKQKISITINEKIVADIDSIIDNIYIRNRSQAIEHLVERALGQNKVAVILAGGSEEDLTIDKEQLCVAAVVKGKTIVERAVKKLRDNNFRSIFVVAQHGVLTRIFEILKDGSEYGVTVQYVEEKHTKGTADSLRLLKGKIAGNFLVVYADLEFSNIKIDALWKNHLTYNAVATLMMTTSARPDRKGTLAVEGNKILDFVQKPKESDVYLVFSPIFAAGPDIFDFKGPSLEDDVFPAIARRGLLIGHLSSTKEVHVHSLKDLERV